MHNEEFTVENVKCGGCVSVIENGLKELTGISEVSVTIEGGVVKVSSDALDRGALSARLAELGYPEA